MCLSIKRVKSEVCYRSYYQRELGNLGKPSGRGWYKVKALCPFHNDKHAGNFAVNIHSGRYKCFACGASGDFIDFHSRRYGRTLPETLADIWRARS